MKVIPFLGDSIMSRDPGERLNEEVYRSIPALNSLANAAAAVGNKLSQEARNALFFNKGQDPELRALTVADSLFRTHSMQGAQPDLEWLRGQEPVSRKEFEEESPDEWLPQPGKQ